MKKISDTLLLYPYPWNGERLVHKDVYQFPLAVARALGCKLHVAKGFLITGEEIEGQSRLLLRTALLLNTFFLLISLARFLARPGMQKPCFVLFHLTWSTAVLASFARLLWRGRACILIKTDLNPNSALAIRGGGSMLERLSIHVLRKKINFAIGETSAATEALCRLFRSSQVLLCRNGIDLSSIQPFGLTRRNFDVIVVSRFHVEKKGVALYSQVVPELVKAGLSVHLIGDGAEAFANRISLMEGSQVKVSEKLQHAEVLRSMRQARLFLSLSLSESFLIAIIEAYAMGCRVISTPVGVASDLARTTSNITIVPFDAADIIKQVMYCITLEQPVPPSSLGGWDEVIEECGLIQRLAPE